MTRQQYNGNHHIIGTAYFIHRTAVRRYYRPQWQVYLYEPRDWYSGFMDGQREEFREWIDAKIETGACNIGEPPPMRGEVRRYINTSEGRWHVVVKTGGEE